MAFPPCLRYATEGDSLLTFLSTIVRLLRTPPAWLLWPALVAPPLATLYPMLGPVLSPLPSHGSNALAHVLVYAILAFPHGLWLGPRLKWGVLGLVLFGFVIEVVQPAFARGAEWTDLLSNLIGVFIGTVLGLRLRTALPRRQEKLSET